MNLALPVVAIFALCCGCAESRCGARHDASQDSPSPVRHDDAGAPCDDTGTVFVGPVIVGNSPATATTCSRHPGRRVRVLLAEASGAGRREFSFECAVGSNYFALGAVPSGSYLMAIDSPHNMVGAGGTLLGHSWCPADPRRRWCPPITVVVEQCAVTVVPAVLRCDPAIDADCPE